MCISLYIPPLIRHHFLLFLPFCLFLRYRAVWGREKSARPVHRLMLDTRTSLHMLTHNLCAAVLVVCDTSASEMQPKLALSGYSGHPSSQLVLEQRPVTRKKTFLFVRISIHQGALLINGLHSILHFPLSMICTSACTAYLSVCAPATYQH